MSEKLNEKMGKKRNKSRGKKVYVYSRPALYDLISNFEPYKNAVITLNSCFLPQYSTGVKAEEVRKLRDSMRDCSIRAIHFCDGGLLNDDVELINVNFIYEDDYDHTICLQTPIKKE